MNISKAKIAKFARLNNKKFRKQEGLFAVEGTKGVVDTLPFFNLEYLVATEDWLLDNQKYTKQVDQSKILTANQLEFNKMSSLSTPSSVIAIYKIIETEFDIEKPLNEGYYLVLDGVQDPGNFGTIIRTAHWFGISKIFCSQDTVDLYNPKTIQSTMGSMAKVEIFYCDILRLIEFNSHMQSYALDLIGEDIFKKTNFAPGFFIMGKEGSGISKEVKQLVGNFLTIPPADSRNHPDSLNVAVATAITLSQVKK